jgi:GxxExxY protein
MPGNPNSEQIERIASAVVDACIKIHKELGPGLLESIYVKILCRELIERGFDVKTECPVQVVWDGEYLGVGYRIDILVNDLVILEVKSADGNAGVFAKQALTYAKLMDLPLAIVLNFALKTMVEGIERVGNGYFAPAKAK